MWSTTRYRRAASSDVWSVRVRSQRELRFRRLRFVRAASFEPLMVASSKVQPYIACHTVGGFPASSRLVCRRTKHRSADPQHTPTLPAEMPHHTVQAAPVPGPHGRRPPPRCALCTSQRLFQPVVTVSEFRLNVFRRLVWSVGELCQPSNPRAWAVTASRTQVGITRILNPTRVASLRACDDVSLVVVLQTALVPLASRCCDVSPASVAYIGRSSVNHYIDVTAQRT